MTTVSIKAMFTLRIKTDFKNLVDKGTIITYWCRCGGPERRAVQNVEG